MLMQLAVMCEKYKLLLYDTFCKLKHAEINSNIFPHLAQNPTKNIKSK